MTYQGEERRKEHNPQRETLRRFTDKEIVKEALKEWLDEKFATFGKWTATGLAAVMLAGLMYLWLNTNGWHK